MLHCPYNLFLGLPSKVCTQYFDLCFFLWKNAVENPVMICEQPKLARYKTNHEMYPILACIPPFYKNACCENQGKYYPSIWLVLEH